MAKNESGLRDALLNSCKRAWQEWRKKYPKERFYAFALYTTPDGEYFVPSISGEDGLTKVAREYVKRKSYATLDEARDALRWSMPDSPYHEQGLRFLDGVEEALDAAPIPYDKSESAADRVIKARLKAAVEAIQSLDKQGLFGKGAKRKDIVLLIEAGDRDQPWALKFAKQLNPKDVYASYAENFETKKLGKFRELGSKQVYATDRLALSADGRILAANAGTDQFCFNIAQGKQLWSRPIERGQYLHLYGCAITDDGSTIAAAWKFDGVKKSFGIQLWSGKDWKQTTKIPLAKGAFDIAIDPRGAWIAVATEDSRVTIYDPATSKSIKVLKDNKEWPRRISASPDGKWLAAADEKAGIFIWDTAKWSVAKKLKRAADCVAFDGTSSLLLSTLRYPNDDDDPSAQSAVIWDVKTGKAAKEFSVPGWRINVGQLSPDGKRVACALEQAADFSQRKAALIDLASGKTVSELAADFEDINDFAFLPDRKTIVVAVHGPSRKPLILWEVS